MDNDKKPSWTTADMCDMVLEHVLEEMALFVPPGSDQVTRMREILDSLNRLAMNVATTSLVNRQNLSALPTFGGKITADPDIDMSGKRYEMRYRVIEQRDNEKPHVDKLYTFDEAVAAYDEDFVNTYWGVLGENCPKRVTIKNDTVMWFTVVRYPVADVSQNKRENQVQRQPGPRQ